MISIHALRVEGDSYRMRHLSAWSYISIHALRVEGDYTICSTFATLFSFLSTPSGWRATEMPAAEPFWHGISIHALRVEGDSSPTSPETSAQKFLSTPSGWRATAADRKYDHTSDEFLSTPSGWRATAATGAISQAETISIHALRVEGDQALQKDYGNL